MGFNRMPEGAIGSNPVMVLAADLFPFDESSSFQIGNDALHGSLGNSDLQCHFAKHH